MCGLAGVLKWPGEPPGRWQREGPLCLEKLSAALARRGPDGQGLWSSSHVALIHRRLAILDAPGGAQPMSLPDASLQVIFNGEIYNHRALRRELQQAGHIFASDHSDTEVLLHGWRAWGMELFGRLRGMFAVALWDLPTQSLILARDPLGQKPLFYATLEDGLVFASTLPAILAWPEVPRRVPVELLALYLSLGYLPPPATIYRDISQVMPGHFLRVRRDVLDGGAYRVPAPEVHNDPLKALRELLPQVALEHLEADVPVVSFLSGGLDSSILAALLQRELQRRGAPPLTSVNVGFADAACDESRWAQQTASHLGTRHVQLQAQAGDLEGTLRELLRDALGQPFADSSLVATYQLSREVRRLAPVALGGDGGDELFGGYDRYRAMGPLGLLSPVLRHLPLRWGGRSSRWQRLCRAARGSDALERYRRLVALFDPELLAALLGEDHWLGLAGDAAWHAGSGTDFQRAMQLDQAEYLPGDLLYKVDSASMACGLEVRAPFLDPRLAALSRQLSPRQLMLRGKGKWLLRQAFGELLPRAILSRPKQGFGVPLKKWLPPGDVIEASLKGLGDRIHPRIVKELQPAADHSHRLYGLWMLGLWMEEFRPQLE